MSIFSNPKINKNPNIKLPTLSFRFISFTIPLVDVDFVVVVFVVVVGFFDVWGPWSGAAGRARLMGEAAPLLLEPNCLVGKDGGVPMTVPWELGIVSR